MCATPATKKTKEEKYIERTKMRRELDEKKPGTILKDNPDYSLIMAAVKKEAQNSHGR